MPVAVGLARRPTRGDLASPNKLEFSDHGIQLLVTHRHDVNALAC